MRRMVLVIYAFLFGPDIAAAQTVEFGGRIAATCVGGEASICTPGISPLIGIHASAWADDRFELGASLARSTRDAYEFAVDNKRSIVTVGGRSREFISIVFAYHFAKGAALRPMLGIGGGWFADARTVSCRPSPCGVLPPGDPEPGRTREWLPDIVWVVGLSGLVSDHWVVRGGWQAHRFMNEENSTQELFLATGYRFGR